jgi:integrase
MSKRRPVSRKGSIGKPRKRKDGTVARRIWWYDSLGKRDSEWVTGDREAAQRRLDTRLREAEEERNGLRVRPKATAPSFSEVAARAAREVFPARQRPRTTLKMLGHLAHWVEPELGTRPVNQIAAADVRAILARMRSQGRKPASCNRVLSAVSAVLEAAREWGYVEHNVCRERGMFQREGRKVPRFLSPEEAQRLLEHASSPVRRLLYALALYTGMRFGELAALRWSDVDLEAGRIIVRGSHDDRPKSGHDRVITLNDEVREYIPAAGEPDELLFVAAFRRDGTPIDRKTGQMRRPPDQDLTATLKRAGITRKITFHDLRHTFATAYLEVTNNVRSLQDLLGHASLATTERYVHLVAKRKAAFRKQPFLKGKPDESAGENGPED